MDSLYIVSEDIAEGVECLLIGRVGGKPFIAASGEGRNGETVGISVIALPKGRIVQAIEGDLYLTEDPRVYRVPFTPS